MTNKSDYVELGLACANVCEALKRGMNGKGLDDLSQPVRDAITQLTTWVERAAHILDGSLTTLLITGPWRRFGGRLPNGTSGKRSLEFFMLGMTRIRSRRGI